MRHLALLRVVLRCPPLLFGAALSGLAISTLGSGATQWRIQGGRREARGGRLPLLTGSISKMVKILHKNAPFWLKISKIILGKGQNLFSIPHFYPPAPPIFKFWIRRWCHAVQFRDVSPHKFDGLAMSGLAISVAPFIKLLWFLFARLRHCNVM